MREKDVAKPANRVDRRRARTRSALIGAGHKLFAAKSIDGVTIDEIVDAADVAKGSFYNHFDDKEGLADTIVELVQGDCEREIYAANADITDADARMARAMGVMIRYAKLHPDRYRAMVNLSKRRANTEAPINAGLRHDIEAGLKSGQFAGMSLKSGMLTVFGIISTVVDYIATAPDAESPAGLANEMAFLLLRALGTPGERAAQISAEAMTDLFRA